jgi:hypothetical protein
MLRVCLTIKGGQIQVPVKRMREKEENKREGRRRYNQSRNRDVRFEGEK